MLTFDWYNDTKIFFGIDKIKKLPELVGNYKSVLLVYDHGSAFKNGAYNEVTEQLKTTNIKITTLDNVAPNPKYDSVIEGVKLCKENNVDLIIPIGGGSVIDCGKTIALATNYEGDFWQDIKENRLNEKNGAIDIGTILTLAATGSETNCYAVISLPESDEKIGYYAKCLLPKFAILNPAYTYTLPKHQVACGVVDSFSHCMEQLFSAEKTAILSDAILMSIMWTLKTITPKLMEKGVDEIAYANLMWAASLANNGMLNLAKTCDWTTHFIEHPLSARYDITHAVGLAVLFPYWLEYILDKSNYDRFYMLGSVFDIQAEDGVNPESVCKKVIKAVREYFTSMDMPSTLREIGIKEADISQLALEAMQGINMVGNFRKLTKEDVEQILRNAL